MACNNPLQAYQTDQGQIIWRETPGTNIVKILRLPCNQCRGCRLERSRQWAIRCLHEASDSDNNTYATFTYDDEHLPEHQTLLHRDWQLFAKRLRKHRGPFRFYMCGEYGDETQRPHYHACLFGLRFPDRKYHSKNANGDILYTSEELTRIWGNGFTLHGAVTFQSAAYIARYVMKKQTGRKAHEHYRRLDLTTGELYNITPEYNKMSLRPAIGRNWYEKYKTDVYPRGTVIAQAHEIRAPRYYDKQYELSDPDKYLELQERRQQFGEQQAKKGENTEQRQQARETVLKARLSTLYRDKT